MKITYKVLELRVAQDLTTMGDNSQKGVSFVCLFVCVEVLRPRQPNGVMSSAVSLPNHTFTGQA